MSSVKNASALVNPSASLRNTRPCRLHLLIRPLCLSGYSVICGTLLLRSERQQLNVASNTHAHSSCCIMHDTGETHRGNNFSLILVFIFCVNKQIRLDTEPPRGRQKFQKVSFFFSLLIIIQCSLKSSLQRRQVKTLCVSSAGQF